MRHTSICLLMLFSLGVFSAGLAQINNAFENSFQKPPASARPHTWWHWMNGHVTKASITRDLLEMKRVGLGGFTLFNTSEGTPPGPVEYASPAWWDLLKHTMAEADRLGLEMGIHNGAGWSATGAAFVTPDMAMQELAWTEAEARGPEQVHLQLLVPVAALGIERDMKKDPEINKRYYVPRKVVEGYFRDIAVYAVPSCPEGEESWYIKDWRLKAGFGKMSGPFEPDERRAPPEQVVPIDRVIDISGYMDEEGVLKWQVPEGRWTILRMGYQPTGRQNHPAAHGGSGLEIDKMSSKAMDFYWEHFLSKVVLAAGEHAGGSFTTIHIDSYEVGHQNWTHDFAEAFIKSRGYDFRKYLPAVTGRIIESTDFTERILWDFRKVIGDLIAENYFGRMARRTSEEGLWFGNEPYGSYGNTNDFNVAGVADIPACEWWAFDGNAHRIGEARLAASAAHTYGGNIVDAEAFTGRPDRIFEAHPGAIKTQGDFFMAQGVNRFSLHTWAHDPYRSTPGFGLGTYGSRFDSRNTWWPYAGAWFEYLSRCQWMLRQGEFVGDVLYYAGEEAPLRCETFHREALQPVLPYGYDYALCNAEIFQQLVHGQGFLHTAKGSSFRVVVLPQSPWMSVGILEKIEQLLLEGAVMVGPKPVSAPGLVAREERERFEALVTRIWGNCDGKDVTSHQLGRGILYWGVPLEQVLKKHGIEPDFSFTTTSMADPGPTMYPGSGMEYHHRRLGKEDIYFLSNQHQQEKEIRASFRVTGKIPEVWFPDCGKMYRIPDVEYRTGSTMVPLHFDPGEAVFVVFREPGRTVAAQVYPGKESVGAVVDLSAGWDVVFQCADTLISQTMDTLVSWTDLQNEALKYHSGTAVYRKNFNVPEDFLLDAPACFLQLGDVQVICEVIVNGISCGIVWKTPYRIEITNAVRSGVNDIEIHVANLWVNRIVGDQQYPDDLEWTHDTGSTAPGKGLKYVPQWVVEDGQRPTAGRKAFYAWKWPHMTRDRALLPSGLHGPVRILTIKNADE